MVAESNWREVETALEAGAAAILPIGAGAKQHGLHLPMNTDFLQAEWLGRRLTQVAKVAVWPTLSYGHYPAFVDYPGSCNLTAELFTALCIEIFNDILRMSARGLIILNTGISTIAPLRTAISNSSRPAQLKLANVYEGAKYRIMEARLTEQPRGGHADELETSIMLVIAPETVRMTLAQACTREMMPGPLNRTSIEHPNYSPSGVYGDPRLASRQKGEVLLQSMLDDLLALLA